MREIPVDKIAVYAGGVVAIALLVPVLHRFPRTRGKEPVYHAIFVAVSITTLFLVPDFIQNEIFSPGGVLVLGTLLPVYSSIVAVCSVGDADDTSWLQFWVASGTLSYTTEFMDEIRNYLPNAGEHWYEFEFLFTLWLMLPFTDGSALIYDKVTTRFITPIATRVKHQVEGWISAILAVINFTYLWMVWVTFISLDEGQKRFIVVAMGTVYPLAASTVALTTNNDGMEVTHWLTYWSCFSVLFVAMDYLENFVGQITGFYSLCLAGTVYLFLPMFNGAEVVFRRVLVPLSGQYENLLLHDAYLVRLGMEKSIPENVRASVLSKAADVFKKDKVN